MSILEAIQPGGPLAEMAKLKQFICWTVKPDKKTGRPYKVTVDAVGGYNVDSQTPANWLSAADAITSAETSPHVRGVGFVFTEDDPFIFVDIDKCLQDDGQWSPVALDLMGCLPGAAVEVSQSGKGLHIFGRCAKMAHSCKNTLYGAECYSAGRFVALTGDRMTGDSALDITVPMVDVIARYFPERVAVRDVAWSDCVTHEKWAGPEDDGELIEIALNSSAAANVFGDSASFRDLWECNEAALCIAYPDSYGDRSWDASSVDGALAMHLAFWTGGNHERIKRLMETTEHVREKWERVEGYFEPTIAGAVSRQDSAYYSAKYDPSASVENSPEIQAQLAAVAAEDLREAVAAQGPGAVEPLPATVEPVAVVVVADTPATVEPDAAARVLSGSRFMPVIEQIKHFKNCVYIRDMHRIMIVGGAMLEQGQFRVEFGGYNFAMDAMNQKTTKSAWEAFTESQGYDFAKVETTCFRPDRPPGEIIKGAANSFADQEIESIEGDVSPFLDHIAKLLPDERDRTIQLSYMAGIVQYQGHKSQWATILQGVEGNGKTMLTRAVSAATGKKYTHMPKADDLDNKFNAWMIGKILIGVEDIYVPDKRSNIVEALKPMITSYDGIEVQAKGKDQVTMDSCANFMFNSNYKDAIRKTKNDRRFCLLFTAQQEAGDLERDGMGGDYFPDMHDWLRAGGQAHVTHFLQTYPIPDEFNFTTKAHRAPISSCTAEAIAASVGPVEQEVMEAIGEGQLGFRGGWVSSIHLNQLLDAKRMSSRMPNRKRAEMLKTLGYVIHPSLTGGRTNCTIGCDGGKPRLYRKESEVLTVESAGEVAKNYEAAQMAQAVTV